MKSLAFASAALCSLALASLTAHAQSAKHGPQPDSEAADKAESAATSTSEPRKPAIGKKPAGSVAIADDGPDAAPPASTPPAPTPSSADDAAPELDADVAVRRSVTGGEDPAFPKAPKPTVLVAAAALDRALFPEPSSADPFALAEGGLARQLTTTGGPSLSTTGLAPIPGASSIADSHAVEPEGDLAWLRTLSMPSIPVRWDTRVVRYLDYYKNTSRGRSMITLWLRRSGRYEKPIREALRQRGMPEDLVWLALMESGFDERIRSGAGAAGLWQFTPDAAKAYGLRVDKYMDERFDPDRATQAAIHYLSDLHTRFGSWELAMAAYNMGYGGLLSSIRKYNTNDYWELSRYEAGIPYETALYVPKILAMAIVAKNRDAFGVSDVTPDPPRAFGKVAVGPGVSLESIAKAAEVEVDALTEMNPQLLGLRTPPSDEPNKPETWSVNVPAAIAAKAQEQLPKETSFDRTYERRRARWGESLDAIAEELGIATNRLRAINGFTMRERIRPGETLLVPRRGGAKAKRERPVAVVAPGSIRYHDRQRVFYEVAPGDEPKAIAAALGVTVDELCRWNGIDPEASMQAGMMLQLFPARPIDKKTVRTFHESEVDILTAGTLAFFDHFEAKKGRRRLLVRIEPGDTWTKLSKRYDISLGMLERINHRSRRSDLVPGEEVVVYCDRQRFADLADDATKPARLADASTAINTPSAE